MTIVELCMQLQRSAKYENCMFILDRKLQTVWLN